MRVELQNMFTGQFDVLRDDAARAEFEAEMHRLALEPFECPACDKNLIKPRFGEHYDEEENREYEYYLHYCDWCGYEEYVDQNDEFITDIILKDREREQERRDYEKLYDRPLV